jgi:hypothetical protein
MARQQKISYPGRPRVRSAGADVDPGRRRDYEVTSGLPESGHNTAVDDRQQPVRPRREEAALVATVARKFRTAGGDRALARRIAKLADEIDVALGDAGFGADADLGPSAAPGGPDRERDFWSTADMELLANEGPDGLFDEPNDMDQQPTRAVLPNRGLHAPTEDEVGPRPADVADEGGGDFFAEVTDDLDPPGRKNGRKGGRQVEPPVRKRSARKQSASPVGLPWDSFKRTLRVASRRGGDWGIGTWETGTEDHGRAIDLLASSHQHDGALLAGEGVTFSLIDQNPKRRTATIEVHDRLIGHESRRIVVAERQMADFVKQWADSAAAVLKEGLN